MNFAAKKSLRMLNWIKSKASKHAIILGYHRISEGPNDPFFLNVSLTNFFQQLEVIKNIATPISLIELAKRVEEKKINENYIAVTFDDGYADNYYRAKPQLDKFNIPATVFVSTGKLNSEFWWDELERLVLSSNIAPEELHLKYNNGSFFWRFSEKEKIKPGLSLFRSLYKVMQHLPETSIYNILGQLKDMMKEEIGKIRYRAMTEDELKLLTSGDLIDLGSHSVSHNIATLSHLDRLRFEIEQSKNSLQEIIQKPITGFSYPNGRVIQGSADLLKQSGYSYACTSYTNYTFSNANKYSLPRFWAPDFNGDKFEKWIASWRN